MPFLASIAAYLLKWLIELGANALYLVFVKWRIDHEIENKAEQERKALEAAKTQKEEEDAAQGAIDGTFR